jgi:hypothetical protein
MVTATFTFDPAEHYRAFRVMAKRRVARTWTLRVSAVFLIVLFVWSFALGGFERPLLWLPYPVALLAGAAVPLFERRAVRRSLSNDPTAKGPQERTVSAEGLHAVANGASADFTWPTFTGIIETKEFFFFTFRHDAYYYIPKRVLDGQQADELRILSRSALGNRASVLAS